MRLTKYVKILSIGTIVLPLLAILVSSCGRGNEAKIVTQDENGKKISDVMISLTKGDTQKIIMTDADGEYKISAEMGKFLTANTMISASKEGYLDTQKTLTDADQTQKTILIKLTHEVITAPELPESAVQEPPDKKVPERDLPREKVTLRRSLTLSVKAEQLDPSGKVVGEVSDFTVSIYGKKEKISGSQGQISFQEPKNGNNVRIRAEKPGYKPSENTITVTNKKKYEITCRFVREPNQYNVKVSLKYGGRFVEGATIQLKGSDGIQIDSETTSASEPVTFRFSRQINSTVSVSATHSDYKISKETFVLTNDKNREVNLEIGSVSLNINCVTSDQNRNVHDAVVVLIQTTNGNEVGRANMSINSKKTVKIPQVTSKLYIIAQTDESDYGQNEPLSYQLKPRSNDVKLVLDSNLRDIQISVKCEDQQRIPIKGVVLTANKAPFVNRTEANGEAVYNGKSRPGQSVKIEGQKAMYDFEPKQIMISESQRYNETLIGTRLQLSLNFTCQSEDGKTIDDFKVIINKKSYSSINGKRTKNLDADPGDIVTLSAESEGYEFLKWNAPVRDSQLKITSAVEYNLIAVFRKLPTLTITLLESKSPHRPIDGVSVEMSGDRVTATQNVSLQHDLTDRNGKVSKRLPTSTGNFTFKFSKENYLSLKDLELQLEPGQSEYSAKRYLLNITPPEQRISLILPIKYDVAFNSILDDPDGQERLQNWIENAISRDFFSLNYFTEAGALTVRAQDNLDEITSAMNSQRIDYAVSVMISQDGDQLQLQANIYKKDGDICASAIVNDVSLDGIQSDIANQVIPELSRTLPIEGYVLASGGSKARLNIGNEQFIQVGDAFEVKKIRVDDSGKFIDYEELSGEYKVVSVDGRTESHIEGPSVSSLTRGSHVKRKATAGGTRSAIYTIVNKLTNSPITSGLYCYIKTQNKSNWTFPTQSIDSGKLVVEIPRESCERKIVISKHKEIPIKNCGSGAQDIRETIRAELAMYSLTVNTTPEQCNVSIAKGSGRNAQTLMLKPGTQLEPGSYTLTVSPPRAKIDEYEIAEISGVIPLPSGVNDWGKGGKAKYVLRGNNISLTIRLAPNWSSVGKKLEAGELSPDEFVRRVQNEAKPTDAKYKDAIFKAGTVLLEELDQPKKAAEEFRKVLQVDPQNPSAYSNTGLCLFKMEKYNEAIEYYRNAEKYQDRLASDANRLRLVHDIRYEIVRARGKLGEPIDTIGACNEYQDFFYSLKKKYERINALSYFNQNSKHFDKCHEKVKMILSEAKGR